uniref:ATP-grasp domain-containing protein n=1 Tax=Minutocellus polymorphus TaxID=265543 RepID=A0A7S0AP48_9STRA|mmetsp:Transcript_18993/g.31491  ORF Transcript_18993/g.31491 Transcript_18993/m.31491 type:complete len:380 (+) Transcript_18993:81-1220(+)
MTTPNEMTTLVAILTLEKHKEGVWITKLVEELTQRFENVGRRSGGRGGDEGHGHRRLQTQVVTLESLEVDRFPLSSPPAWAGLVNRVSDAASPILVKSTLAILQSAELWGIPIFNGPRSYAICCNKIMHHQVFAKAGLKTPRSVVVNLLDNSDLCASKLSDAVNLLEKEMGCKWPFLIKPNSGGFGSGIHFLRDEKELQKWGRDMCSINNGSSKGPPKWPSEDGIVLLSEYIRPVDESIYRVWFLDRKVQCAVRRRLLDCNDNPVNDFTAGCAGGGSCALSYMKKKRGAGLTTFAWEPPEDVVRDISKTLEVLGDDCDAGSVEFLYNSDRSRLYFDLNLLSTMPQSDGSIGNEDIVWEHNYNHWLELANAVAKKVVDKK